MARAYLIGLRVFNLLYFGRRLTLSQPADVLSNKAIDRIFCCYDFYNSESYHRVVPEYRIIAISIQLCGVFCLHATDALDTTHSFERQLLA